MAGPVSPSLPHSLAWQRCHREHQTNGWRDRKGWRDGEEEVEEENKRIVLGVEKGVLWTRQIAYVGERGGGRRGTKGQRKVKPGIFLLLGHSWKWSITLLWGALPKTLKRNTAGKVQHEAAIISSPFITRDRFWGNSFKSCSTPQSPRPPLNM